MADVLEPRLAEVEPNVFKEGVTGATLPTGDPVGNGQYVTGEEVPRTIDDPWGVLGKTKAGVVFANGKAVISTVDGGPKGQDTPVAPETGISLTYSESGEGSKGDPVDITLSSVTGLDAAAKPRNYDGEELAGSWAFVDEKVHWDGSSESVTTPAVFTPTDELWAPYKATAEIAVTDSRAGA